ncbi:hypothetical protein F4813DRAFT_384948 [Daldinia decipiens]|uniref:uncharacterized protein n=1 Tax=Daldinia decipiens TaxID=326647 RepID=UPI0020C4BFD8|nr:uncharacterized protein F4813DRAFT_384948 [Daldinia decipiens]KAI1662236.1 hypothetical protein F4813DRAFT_384948 [Daldinia decipiens]
MSTAKETKENDDVKRQGKPDSRDPETAAQNTEGKPGTFEDSKGYTQLDLAHLTEVTAAGNDHATSDNANEDDESAFNRPVLHQKIKDMVLSLIAQHFRNEESQQNADEQLDIVRGKANRWGCILLLDEADIFLASRIRDDFTRNGLVAEYYAGILFLTTNRIGDFDEAFISWIHMSLYYPPLDEIATNRIFKLNFDLIRDRYKENGRPIDIDDSGIYSFVTKFWVENQQARWNGRQIRNACQTALALLSEFEALPKDKRFDLKFKSQAKVHLKHSNIETVSDAYLEFVKYLKAIHGTDQETHAKELGIRAIEQVFDSMMNERVSRGGNSAPQERLQNQNPRQATPNHADIFIFEHHSGAPYNPPGPAYRNPSPSSGTGYSSHGYQSDNPFLQAPHASSGYGATQQYPRHTQSVSPEGSSAHPPELPRPQYYPQGQWSGISSDPRFAQSIPGQGTVPPYQGWRSEAYPVAGQAIAETTGLNLTSIPISHSAEDPNIQHGAPNNLQ